MAISLRNNFLDSSSLITRLQTIIFDLERVKLSLTCEGKHSLFHAEAEVQASPISEIDKGSANPGDLDVSTWKVVDAGTAGIKKSIISAPTWIVLKLLQTKGYEAYLVGGCVRDLLMKKTPKDFDVVTSAKLKEVKKRFNYCQIVGKKFPICRVHIKGSVVEVSSFTTTHEHAITEKETITCSQMPTGCDTKDFVRWRNCMERDFTINGLFYDPFINKVYDYANGMKDLKMCKMRTLIPAHLSFKLDSARILRGLRIAARLGLAFSKETATAIRDLSSSIAHLDNRRLMMELNYMMAFGAAQPSLLLLQKYKLLEILLPIHASYLAHQAKRLTTGSPNMLMHLFANMDKLLAPDRPCDRSLWIGLLAFHLALLNHPQNALLLWAFSSALYHGDWRKAVGLARGSAQMNIHFVPEISETIGTKSDKELLEEVSQFASLAKSSVEALTDMKTLLEAMTRYPRSPSSGLVIISKNEGSLASKLFDDLESNITSCDNKRENFEIDYKLLAKGDREEVRFVLGKILLDTMNGGVVHEQNQEVAHKEKHQPRLSSLFA